MHRTTASLVLALAAGAAFAADPIDNRALSDSKVTLVDVSQAGSPGKSFVAGTIIRAPLPKVCAVLQDYAAYPSFMPNTESVKVSQSGPGHALIDVTLKLAMGKIKKYRLRMEPKLGADSCLLSWKQVPWPGLKQEETIADTTGHWQLSPGPTPGTTPLPVHCHTSHWCGAAYWRAFVSLV